MGLLKKISILTGIENSVEWSQSKMLAVEEPGFFGKHFVYIDLNFNVAIFLLKEDKSLFLFLGDVVRAHEWRKYDQNGEVVAGDKKFPPNAFEWKINPKEILYRGIGLPRNQRIYCAVVHGYRDFHEQINEHWISSKVGEFIQMFKQLSSQ